jgi:hypothetical protein
MTRKSFGSKRVKIKEKWIILNGDDEIHKITLK